MLKSDEESGGAGADAEPKVRRAAFAFIFITVLLDMLALGMILPVLPRLIVDFLAGDTPRAAEIFGVFGMVWALMQFLFSPLLGALSDRFGRRPIVLISNFGLGFDYILMALAPNLIVLFIGRVISGITAASISTGFAYIADVTPVEKRAARFGMLGGAFGAGFVLGPALGGFLGEIDLRLPFSVAAGLSIANGFYGLFILPESLTPERRMAFSWKRANPVGSLNLLRAHPGLLGLATITFLSHLAHAVLPSVTVLYMGYRYQWSEQTIGLMLAAVGISAIVVQAGLTGLAVRTFGERRTLLFGLAFGAIGFAIYGLAPNGMIFSIGIPVMALWGLASPAIQGLMSQRVSSSEQGQLQGANTSVMSIASMIGPGLFTLTFAFAIRQTGVLYLPGFPFLLAAASLIAAMLVAYYVTKPQAGARNESSVREGKS